MSVKLDKQCVYSVCIYIRPCLSLQQCSIKLNVWQKSSWSRKNHHIPHLLPLPVPPSPCQITSFSTPFSPHTAKNTSPPEFPVVQNIAYPASQIYQGKHFLFISSVVITDVVICKLVFGINTVYSSTYCFLQLYYYYYSYYLLF